MDDLTKTNDGGSAFPCAVPPGFVSAGCGPHVEFGMSLRDYLASQEHIDTDEVFGYPLLEALAGKSPGGAWDENPLEWFAWSNRWQAAVKYARADAMLEARAQNGGVA